MKKSPKVSVLMPVYNGDRFLPDAIDSILKQTFTDYELIIIDDASTDNSWQILREYASLDERIRLFRNQDNMGLAAALNRGLKVAKGEYIARMDQDDISLPERFATQAAFLDTNSDVDVLGSATQIIDEWGELTVKIVRHPTRHYIIFWALCFYTPFVHPSVMFRKNIVESVGGYDEIPFANEDRDLWTRLSSIAQFANVDKIYLLHRRHSDSLSMRYSDIRVRNGARAIQNMISEVLGYEVAFEVCYNIRRRQFETPDQAVRVVRLIRLLYQAFMRKKAISELEKKIIRRDAIHRIYRFARPYWYVSEMRKEFFAFALGVKIVPIINYLVRRPQGTPWNVIAM